MNINYKKIALSIALGIFAGNLMIFAFEVGADYVVEALL